MTREEYLELKKKADETTSLIGIMIDANLTDSDSYKRLKDYANELEEKIAEYEKQKVKDLLDNNLENDMQECFDSLNPDETYSVGIHLCGVNNRIMSEGHELAKSILEKGLISARREGGGLLENVYMLGTEDLDTKLAKSFEDAYIRAVSYNLGGVIVAIPATMLTSEGRVSIGEFPNDLDFVAKDDPRCTLLPINLFVRNIGYLPPEFILGVVSNDMNGETIFTKNERYISKLSEEEQIELYEKFVGMGLQAKPIINRTM